MVEIEEESSSPPPESTPLLQQRKPQLNVPEAQVHVYRQGKGPIEVFKLALVGYEQDQLEVRDILDRFGFKSIYAFSPGGSGRGVPIRFNPKNGRSLLTYRDGAVVYLDGEPKDSLVMPVTRILVGVAVITCLIILVMKETPKWAKTLNFSGGRIPPWVLACAVIVFTRLRKRTKGFAEKLANRFNNK